MTNEMQYVKSLLTTGTGSEGTLLIQRTMYGNVIEEADRALLDRSVYALYFGPGDIPGSSVDVSLAVASSMRVRRVAEGASIFLDTPEWTSFNLRPVKYGVGLRATTEMEEDSRMNLLDFAARLAGKRFAENETSLAISDGLDNAANTVAGGAALTVANITQAIQYLEDADYEATDALAGNEVWNDLRNMDLFTEADKSGDNEVIRTGKRAVFLGIVWHRASVAAGLTSKNAYIFDRRWALVFAEKRPITLEGFRLPDHDMSGVSITQRLKIRHLRSDAIVKVTTT